MTPSEHIKSSITIKQISQAKETNWINPYKLPHKMTRALCSLTVSDEAVTDAEERLLRFAPFIAKSFPETAPNGGLIESPLTEIPYMKLALEKKKGGDTNIPGKLFLKQDSHLAIAGSVKARGGIYEVLCHAERLALEKGKLLPGESYEKFANESMKKFFSDYTVQVGSTGNLGLSIGIMSAAIGFRVKIHMSSDAKQWKKDLLRSHGVTVLEYDDDYSHAVAEGRRLSDADPSSYFVDDEHSVDLFLGYATAAGRLKNQLCEKGILPDEKNPLFVYIPAGVGGAPGGITYGLKRLFGDNVHCFFAEPTQFPSVILGIATQEFEKVNVRDYGLGKKTCADGLACASPSGLVTRLMTNLVSGGFTVSDENLREYMYMLRDCEGIRIEPSSCAAFAGVSEVSDYCAKNGIDPQSVTHLAWATGGSMVPEADWDRI